LAVQTLAPPAELELAGQEVQALDPVIAVYVPALHDAHAAAEEPPVPALKVPAEHERHTLDELADVVAE
jgi:hypothetical protein